MKRRVFIAHAKGEVAMAEALARPLAEAGYEVVHHGTVLVGGSFMEEAQKQLAADGPVVVCVTVKAVGTNFAHRLVNASRESKRGRTFLMQMEEDAYVDLLSLDEEVPEWWRDHAAAEQRLVETLKQYYPLDERASVQMARFDAERRYRQLALEACDIINLANLPEGERDVVSRKLELRKLYVPLRVRVEASSQDEAADARLKALEQRRAASLRGVPDTEMQVRFPLGERLAEAKRLVVLGDPGAGKSTLIRWLATAYLLRLKQDPELNALPDIATLPDRHWLPIIVRCRDLDPASISGSLSSILRHTLRKTEMLEAEVEVLQAVLLQKLAEGEALLLIDGLDEISEAGARVRFCEQLEKIHVAMPAAPIVVTSRVVGYREMMGHRIGRGFEHVTVDDLSPEDKDDFVRRWCAVTEPAERRATIEEELISDIHSTDRIERLTGNPMLLTTMALVKRKVGKLPRRRTDLYWEAVQVLLNWRRAEANDPLELWEALPQLGFVAYAMCDRGVQRLRRDEVLSLLHQVREEYPRLHDVRRHSPENFLILIERYTGILIESGHEKHQDMSVPVYEFRHLTFQEYLAARALVHHCFPSAPQNSLAENIAPLAMKPAAVGGQEESHVQHAASWPEVLRLCVAICGHVDVDAVLLAIFTPLPGEPLETAVGLRAFQAALCLVDEPNASDEVARRILLKLAEHLDYLEPSPSLVPILSLLMETRWNWELMLALAHEFRIREAHERILFWRVVRRFVMEWKYEAGTTPQDWVALWVAKLSAKNDLEVIASALRLSVENFWKEDCTPPSVQGDELMALIARGGAVAHASALALHRLKDSVNYGELWSPTPTQLEQLASVYASEVSDTGALISLTSILGSERVESSVDAIISRLRSEDSALRAAAANALGVLQDVRALAPLAQAIKDTDRKVKRMAILALGYLRDINSLEMLSERLQDPDEDTRSAAVEALSLLPGSVPVTALREAIGDPSEEVRHTLVWRLRERMELADMELLIRLLDDPVAANRLGAIRIMAELKSPLAVAPLLAWMERPLEPLAEGDFLAMALRGHGFFKGRFLDHRLLWTEAALALGEIQDSSAVEPLHDWLGQVDEELRPAVLHSLGKIGDTCAVEWLVPWLSVADERTSLGAAEALARLGDGRGRAFLISKLVSESFELRVGALELLAGLYPEDEMDERLLLVHEYRDTLYMDPSATVDDARLKEIEEQMGIPRDEARRGFEVLVQKIPLKLAWQVPATPAAR
ncbi:HEAT repeat domain-containing protein [Myxococcus qinghaiensis]|uniref:HEAT repeat domain-containing protein n=1 Tax=Myxococcus qinghaiensis TaxID=2906758 RepID=UPI0020A79298|nr:HEAT repeat domain-containing protein [Myxococcus qinghaiensis]MCP3169063.1 HEAT repeat domain-containing protein [Myxococcus qinghaiensis]